MRQDTTLSCKISPLGKRLEYPAGASVTFSSTAGEGNYEPFDGDLSDLQS